MLFYRIFREGWMRRREFIAALVETVRVVPVEAYDDSKYIDIKIPIGLTVINWLIVRAVRVTGTGADISAVVLA
jgi:hypothetical protein